MAQRKTKRLPAGTPDSYSRDMPVGETSQVSDQCVALTRTGSRCARAVAVVLGRNAFCAQHGAMVTVTLKQPRASVSARARSQRSLPGFPIKGVDPRGCSHVRTVRVRSALIELRSTHGTFTAWALLLAYCFHHLYQAQSRHEA